MTLFWAIATILTLLALAFAAVPMLRNKPLESVDADALNVSIIKQQLTELDADLANGSLDQTQYDAARRDLERELLRDVSGSANRAAPRSGAWAIAVVAAGIPLAAVGVYQTLGYQEIITRLDTLQKMTAGSPRPAAGGEASEHAKDLPPMDELVEKLRQRLLSDPDNIEGWIMLGRSYLAMGRADEALNAFQSAYQRAPQDPDILIAYAQALVRTNQGELSGEAGELVKKAYAADPSHPTSIWMMGLVHFEREEYTETVRYWEQLAAMLPPDSDEGKELANYIQQARERMGDDAARGPATVQSPAATPTPAATPEPEPAPAGGSIYVSVSLDPALAAQANPDDRVFIFARALSGPPMPLAAVSKQVSDLPLQLTLDDSLAMMPQMKLSGFPQVLVGARISKSGSATPQSGDLQGEISPVAPGQDQAVQVVINNVRP